MADQLLNDVLNNLITTEQLFAWLSEYEDGNNQGSELFEKYNCDQDGFVGYFMDFLVLHSSKTFEVETSAVLQTPRKTPRLNPRKTIEKTPEVKRIETGSVQTADLNFSSQQSFPSLPGSGRNDSLDTPDSPNKSRQSTSSRRGRRVKLFGDVSDESLEKENRGVFSTPKLNQSSPDVSGFFGGVQSPLEGLTPQTWKTRGRRDSNRSGEGKKNSSRPSLGDFILSDSSPVESKKERPSKARRRINPTKVTDQQTPSVFMGAVDDVSNREQLKKLCADIKEQIETDTTNRETTKVPLKIETQPSQNPETNMVTKTHHLDTLADVFGFLFKNNFCLNLTMELYFVVSLLVVPGKSSEFCNLLLATVDNCVYFACRVLWNVRDSLLMLSSATVKLLCENQRVAKFAPELQEFLKNALLKLEVQCWDNSLRKSDIQGNVSFSCETDSKENFTLEVNFYSFKKQRDLFYTILEVWEKNHLGAGWNFSKALGGKIWNLMGITSDPVNLMHLARLFRSQLLTSCCGTGCLLEEGDADEVLQLLPSVDPSKLSRLKARLTGSPKCAGPCPAPDFPGTQEFYKNFILHTCHGTFHRFLQDSFCEEIHSLNETEFGFDVECSDSRTDGETRSRYLHCVTSLRLLGKFLGFVEFLPYRSASVPSEEIILQCVAVRDKAQPLLDTSVCLTNAFMRGNLTLVVPWLVMYLAMLDHASTRLQHHRQCLLLLLALHRRLRHNSNPFSAFFLSLNIGWLFQLPLFSAEFLSAQLPPLPCSLPLCQSGLDASDHICETIVLSVCPYIDQIRALLLESAAAAVRHIRPVTTQSPAKKGQEQAKQLELRLEESFLHNQSSSTRKTVEFTTERVASCAIKQVMRDIVTKAKKTALSELFNKNKKNTESQMVIDARAVAVVCHAEINSASESLVWEACRTRCDKAVHALLSSELPSDVIMMCVQLATRQSVEKTRSWIEKHISLENITNEFLAEVKRAGNKTPAAEKLFCDVLEHAPVESKACAVMPSAAIVALREVMWRIAETELTVDEVEKVTKDGAVCFVTQHNGEMIPQVAETLFALLQDFMLTVCVYGNDEMYNKCLRHFDMVVDCVNTCLKPEFISQATIHMVLEAKQNRDRAWRNLAHFVVHLVQSGRMEQNTLEERLNHFLLLNSNPKEFEDYCNFVRNVSTQLKNINSNFIFPNESS